MRILYAEDEPDMNNAVTRSLRDEQYSVDSCRDGQEAIDCLAGAEYDVVILDIMMPRVDGYQVLSYIRKKDPALPVLLLTAKDSVDDRVLGLDSGANDYLVKPFSVDELLARVRVLTRFSHQSGNHILKAGDLTVDTTSHVVKRGDVTIDLTAKEYQLLEYLMYNKGSILSRSKIENHIWNYDYEGGTNVVDVYIRYLRQKIDRDFSPKLIHTKRGLGYMISEEAK